MDDTSVGKEENIFITRPQIGKMVLEDYRDVPLRRKEVAGHCALIIGRLVTLFLFLALSPICLVEEIPSISLLKPQLPLPIMYLAWRPSIGHSNAPRTRKSFVSEGKKPGFS